MKSSLPNYIKTYRRRVFLSQDELAMLLGRSTGTMVVRHESDQRAPTLDTALAYAAALQVDPRELFAGHYEVQAKAVCYRAKEVLDLAQQMPQSEATQQRVAHLELLASGGEPFLLPCEN